MFRRDRLERRVAAAWPPATWNDVTVVVAVSGGGDSVALLHCLRRLQLPGRGRLVVAHFHHGLRGEPADRDAAFVAELAAAWGLACEIGRARTDLSEPPPAPDEATARHTRYAFLRATAHRLGARYVAVAHTADDQAETVLQRLLRGTGVTGLAGMPRTRRLSLATSLIRPFLDLRRAQVRHYLTRHQWACCQDETNDDTRYTRNRIRQELLPLLARDYNPQVSIALTRLATQAAELRGLVEPLVEQLVAQVLIQLTPGEVLLDTAPLSGQPPALVRELFVHLWRQQQWPAQRMTAAHWSELAAWAMTPAVPTKVGAESQRGVRREWPRGVVGERVAENRLRLTSPCSA
ncbi:MAG: tRNA lysidine(34) synthetase TilS [Pirellulales bacterium]